MVLRLKPAPIRRFRTAVRTRSSRSTGEMETQPMIREPSDGGGPASLILALEEELTLSGRDG
jgi:hypothetical protein